MPQGKAYDADVRTEVERLCLEEGLTAAEIVRRLEQSEQFADRCPKDRTVQHWVRQLKPRDTSGPWSLATATDTAEAQAVPRVWAEVAQRRSDRKQGVTQREAILITRLVAALPSLHPWHVWRLVVAYLRRADRGLDTADLDLLVGSASEWLAPERTWLTGDNVDAAIEAARRRHFNRHRELWPDREYIFLPRADEYPGPFPSINASNERLGRGEKVDITEREADDLVYFLAVLRTRTSLGTPEADLE